MEELEEVRGKVIKVSTLPTWVATYLEKELDFKYKDFLGCHIDLEDMTEVDEWMIDNFKGIEQETMIFLDVDVELNTTK